MPDGICTLDGCDRPIRRADLCYSHYMKQWRHGDPRFVQTFEHQDVAGQRFGTLVAVRRVDGLWLCECDCGRSPLVRLGDLNRGRTGCGDRSSHLRTQSAGNGAAHQRVRQDRGPAKDQRCTDCDEPASHWSYDHRDPKELQSERGPYSLDPSHYEARCVPCHKTFDLAHLADTRTP